jgi:hypothetical protein
MISEFIDKQRADLFGEHIYESFDKHLIVSMYTLVYLYNWLDIKEQIFMEIDTVYGQGMPSNEDDDTPVLDLNPPKLVYEPISILGPLIGCIIKTLLVSFVLFLLVNAIVICVSIFSILPYDEDYLKEDVRQAILKNNSPELIQGGGDFDSDNESSFIGGGMLGFKTLTPEEKAQKQEMKNQQRQEEKELKIMQKQEEKALKQQQKQEAKARKLEEKRKKHAARLARIYRVSKDIPKIFETTEADELQEALLTKVRTYWLFFIKKFHISLIILVTSIAITLFFTKLIVPHVNNIATDASQMKTQMMIVMYMNLGISVGGIWYLAMRED